MFVKAKLKVWLLLIAISFLFSKGSEIATTIYKNHMDEELNGNSINAYSINVENVNASIKNKINGTKFKVDDKNFELLVNQNNSDIIITKNEYSESGYKKLENYLYVPYVMIANPYLSEISQTYINKNNVGYTKDMRSLLLDIESEKNWKEAGLDNEYLIEKTSNPIKLIIPSELSDDYAMIREYFIYALNGYSKPNENEYKKLEKRVDDILNKCDKIENVSVLFQQSSYLLFLLNSFYFLHLKI